MKYKVAEFKRSVSVAITIAIVAALAVGILAITEFPTGLSTTTQTSTISNQTTIESTTATTDRAVSTVSGGFPSTSTTQNTSSTEFLTSDSNQSSSQQTTGLGPSVEDVGQTLDAGLAGYPYRNDFQADGLTWLFYTNGTDLVYQTTKNGSVWSNPTPVRPQTTDYHFSTWYDAVDNTVYYVSVDSQNFAATSSNQTSTDCQATPATSDELSTSDSLSTTSGSQCLASGFWYRWGTLDDNGTIDWAISEGFVQTGAYAANPYIYGSGDRVWVSLQTNGGSDVEVWKSASPTSWSRALYLQTAEGTISMVLPLQSGVALVYFGGYYNAAAGNRYEPVYVITSSDGGASWTQPVSTTDYYLSASALAIGNTIYFVGVDNSTSLRFWSFALANSSMSEERVIASNATAASITTDGVTDLVLAYTDGYTVYSSRSASLGSSWGASTLVAAGSAYPIVAPLVVPYVYNSTVPICWTVGSNQSGAYTVACANVTPGA